MSKELAAKREGSALAPLNIGGAIEAAAALGTDGVEVLERLHAIQKDEREAEARRLFNAAVAEMHRRLGSIQKNRTAHFKTKSGASVTYRYADLHGIATALRSAGAGDLGLSWSWDTEYADGAEIVTCTLSHDAGHSRKATWRAPIEQGNPMTSAPQKAKIATTFAQRVTLIQSFGLTDTEDDLDGQMPDDAPVRDAETITDAQALELEALIESTGSDFDRFKAAFGVSSLADFPAARFGEALGLLKRKAKAAK